jgi:hypothetical protein
MSGIQYEVLTGDALLSALRGGSCGDLLEDAADAAADEIERLQMLLAEAKDAFAIARFNCEAQAEANIALEKRLAEADAALGTQAEQPDAAVIAETIVKHLADNPLPPPPVIKGPGRVTVEEAMQPFCKTDQPESVACLCLPLKVYPDCPVHGTAPKPTEGA